MNNEHHQKSKNSTTFMAGGTFIKDRRVAQVMTLLIEDILVSMIKSEFVAELIQTGLANK